MVGGCCLTLLHDPIRNFLSIVDLVRDKYERDGRVVDAETREALPLPPPKGHLNEEQARVVLNCLNLENAAADVSWKWLKRISPFVSLSMRYTEPEKNKPR